jgi:hypothetical protein
MDSYAEGKRYKIMEQMQNRPMTAIFRIILNHWPILTRTSRFIKPFINDLEPNLILKGDSHHVCQNCFFEFDKIKYLITL